MLHNIVNYSIIYQYICIYHNYVAMLYNNARWYRMLNNSAIYAVIWHVMKHWHDSGQPARCAPIHSQPDSFITRQAILPICFHFQILKLPHSCLRRATLQQAIPKLCQFLTQRFLIFKLKFARHSSPHQKWSADDIWYDILFLYAVCVQAAPLCSPRLRGPRMRSPVGVMPRLAFN